MNKKHLSVVMAGAMLATSVAPVLAATETTVNNSNKGLLIKRLRELLESKTFSDVKENDVQKDDTILTKHDEIGESVYCVKIGSKEYGIKDIEEMEEAIKNAEDDTVITVYDRGFVEKDGVVYNHALETITVADTMTATDLAKTAEDFSKENPDKEYSDAIIGMEYNEEAKELTVKVRTAASESEYKTLTYKEGSVKVDFNAPVNAKGEAITGASDWKELAGFAQTEGTNTVTKGINIPAKVIETINFTDVDKEYTTVLSNLYDGLFLTANGEKLLETLKEYDALEEEGKGDVKISSIENDGRGLYSIKITLEKEYNKKPYKQLITITTNNRDQLKIFADGIAKDFNNHFKITRRFPVQVIAGDNRYETAVKVAKEYADIETVAVNGNIVLVNGNSLVDGLAAAPLAASVVNQVNLPDDVKVNVPTLAPILLTSADGIPAETKAYMKEIIGYQRIKNLDKVTVYLVGGETVISPAVEKDLKEIGFRVVRAGGKDREATSLEVANLIEKDTTKGNKRLDEAFVVGADGEADAMSIAPVASALETPIIVESKHGLSDDAVEYLKGYKNTKAKDVTIVGGENVVSKETEDKLADAKVDSDRLAGKNRQETNALVIDAFYGAGEKSGILDECILKPGHKFDNVVVSKDGQRNKSELIDALTATSLAVRDYAPIVLGTNKLSNEQINTLEMNADRNGVYVYQVGNGVAREVVKTIAERIGLAK